MQCLGNIRHTMRNLDITTEEAQDGDRWRTIISGNRKLLFFSPGEMRKSFIYCNQFMPVQRMT